MKKRFTRIVVATVTLGALLFSATAGANNPGTLSSCFPPPDSEVVYLSHTGPPSDWTVTLHLHCDVAGNPLHWPSVNIKIHENPSGTGWVLKATQHWNFDCQGSPGLCSDSQVTATRHITSISCHNASNYRVRLEGTDGRTGSDWSDIGGYTGINACN